MARSVSQTALGIANLSIDNLKVWLGDVATGPEMPQRRKQSSMFSLTPNFNLIRRAFSSEVQENKNDEDGTQEPSTPVFMSKLNTFFNNIIDSCQENKSDESKDLETKKPEITVRQSDKVSQLRSRASDLRQNFHQTDTNKIHGRSKSDSLTPEFMRRSGSDQFCKIFKNNSKPNENQDNRNYLKVISPTLMLRNITRSPLVKRMQRYMYRAESRQRMDAFYERQSGSAKSLPTLSVERVIKGPINIQSKQACKYEENGRDKILSNSLETMEKTKRVTRNSEIFNKQLMIDENQGRCYSSKDSGFISESKDSLSEMIKLNQSKIFIDHGKESLNESKKRYRHLDFNGELAAKNSNAEKESIFCEINLPHQKHGIDKHCPITTKMLSKYIPKLKVSIQIHSSRKQMNVTLTDVMNLNQLCDNESKTIATICLMPGKRQQKKTIVIKQTRSYTFNALKHFDLDDLRENRLRICLLEKNKYVNYIYK